MKKLQVSLISLVAALAAPAFAQTPATPATTSNDPIVQMRAMQRDANSAYAKGLIAAYQDRQKKVGAAVEAAVNEANAAGKDPLVAKRDADVKASKATKAEYDAQLKKLADERKAAMAAAAKTGKGGK
ncbi:MAG: hypothetical protein ACK58C_07670 [Betaproteobacteria bacterium]